VNHTHIVRIPILPMHMLNAHLIIGPDGCLLMDSGIPGSENKIAAALSKVNRGWKDIKLIISTHAHMDHAGSTAMIRELSDAPIVAHQDDAMYYNQEEQMTYCPTGIAGRYLLKRGIALRPYVGFIPDKLISNDQSFDLHPYGVPGKIRHTPGHTAGSLSVELDSSEALVGDLVASGILMGGICRKNRPIRPPFEDNPQQVAYELQQMVDAGYETFYLGHGWPLGRDAVLQHIQKLRRL